MNDVTELTATELEQVEGGFAFAFLVNFALSETGFFAWANNKIGSWLE